MSNRPPQPSTSRPTRIWTTLDLIRWTKDFFARKGIESARLEAELLLAGALDCDRIKLYTDFEDAIPDSVLATFREWVRRRGEDREPLAYILGHAQFLELKLQVSPAVLIPRPETEELAIWGRSVVKEWANRPEVRVLDVGTGSGCLALALASDAENVRALALDISSEALDLARQNAASLKLEDRVTFLESDVYSALQTNEQGRFDLIIANPPYIDPELKDSLQPEVRAHEPEQALCADHKGLAVIERLVAEAGKWTEPGGKLGIEISPEMAPEVCRRLTETGDFEQVAVRQDARKMDRFVTASR